MKKGWNRKILKGFPDQWGGKIFVISILMGLLLCFTFPVHGQDHNSNSPSSNHTSNFKAVLADAKTYLEQTIDPALPEIFRMVPGHCEGDSDCQYELYRLILKEIQLGNSYWQGVPIAEEMIRISKENNDPARTSVSIKELADLHNFMENREAFYQAYRDLLDLYESTGDQAAYYRTKFYMTERQAKELDEVEETMDELEGLMAEAKALGLDRAVSYMLLRIKVLYQRGPYDKYTEIIEALEEIPIGDHRDGKSTLRAFHTYSGRGDLLVREGRYDQALGFYLKARETLAPRHFTFHDTWLDIYVLQQMAHLEEARNRPQQASAYLDSAYVLATESNLRDQVIETLRKQVVLAESNNRFADALAYTREIYQREAVMDSLAQGFDEQRYHLESIRKQLTVDNEKQTLELKIKDNQLNFTIIIAVLSLFLIVGLFIGFRRQSKNRKALANQNRLIQRQTEELKKLDAAKSRFFANVSHELRTPLTLMLGPLNTVLKDKGINDKHTKLLTLANQNGKQLQQLINEILDLRKLEMDTLEVNMTPTDLFTFFTRHFTQFESLAAENQIDYSFDLAFDDQVFAPIDQKKIKQVLNNLLSNAFKFTPGGENIKARVFIEEDQLHISVADSGRGIPSEDLPYVFDRYFQSNQPENPLAGGTGIGLALCEEYARLFGGDLTVQSTWKNGATFLFRFPVVIQKASEWKEKVHAQIETPLINPSSPTVSPQEVDRASILIVEDNPDLQAYLQLILADSYSIQVAGNGQEALTYLEQSPNVDLILSDIMMPVMDGFQMLEKVKSDERLRHIPMIMLTARSDMRIKLKALRIGVDDYLQKPFNEEELKVRITNLLAHQRARKEVEPENQHAAITALIISDEDRVWLEAFEQYCKAHYASDILDVPSMAVEFAMSESTFLRQVKRLTGLSPAKYINEIRLDIARQLLEDRTYNSVSKVGYEVGFTNTNSFSRAFKKRFGNSPSHLLAS